MSESVIAFFIGFILACSLIIIKGLSPKDINEQWEKKLIEKNLGEYVVETVDGQPTIKFQFKDE